MPVCSLRASKFNTIVIAENLHRALISYNSNRVGTQLLARLFSHRQAHLRNRTDGASCTVLQVGLSDQKLETADRQAARKKGRRDRDPGQVDSLAYPFPKRHRVSHDTPL